MLEDGWELAICTQIRNISPKIESELGGGNQCQCSHFSNGSKGRRGKGGCRNHLWESGLSSEGCVSDWDAPLAISAL